MKYKGFNIRNTFHYSLVITVCFTLVKIKNLLTSRRSIIIISAKFDEHIRKSILRNLVLIGWKSMKSINQSPQGRLSCELYCFTKTLKKSQWKTFTKTSFFRYFDVKKISPIHYFAIMVCCMYRYLVGESPVCIITDFIPLNCSFITTTQKRFRYSKPLILDIFR